MNHVRVNPGPEHDEECPVSLGADPMIPGLVRRYRVTRPFVYRSPSCPGHNNLEARSGVSQVSCCATQAARTVTNRLLKSGEFSQQGRVELLSESLDVEMWEKLSAGEQESRMNMGAISDKPEKGPSLTQLAFDEEDFEIAERVARSLGFRQTAYTSSSALWGLFCLPDRASQRKGCIIKTREFGLMFVADLEDMLMDKEGRRAR